MNIVECQNEIHATHNVLRNYPACPYQRVEKNGNE